MKQTKSLLLAILSCFALNSFAQNVTSKSDLGIVEKSNSDGANYLCQANILNYHTIKENRNSLTGVNIDIYNVTTQTQELSLKQHALNKFSFNFKHGNKYILMLRKEGYLVKRITAKIGIEGCIACFEGLNTLTPLNELEVNSITNMNILMRKFNEGDRILLPEIQFEGKSAQLTENTQQALNDLAILLKDNSNILGQLELHTDARGDADDNLELSKKRAEAVSDYLALNGISKDDIYVKGYGERKIVNHCIDGVNCGETQHAKNRRALFWLRASIGDNPVFHQSLTSILENEGNSLVFKEETRAPILKEEVKEETKEEVVVAFEDKIEEVKEEVAAPAQKIEKEEVVQVSTKQEDESEALAKIDKAIPRVGENQSFGSSNLIDVDAQDVKNICDPNGEKPNDNRVEELAPVDNPLAPGGLGYNKTVKDKVTLDGPTQISEEIMVTYTDEGKDVRISGRATLFPETFTGYAVELFTSVDELDNSHSVFKRYGEVFLDDTGTEFSYLIGQFQHEDSADNYLKTVIKPFYPKAKVIRYKEGKRK